MKIWIEHIILSIFCIMI